MYELSNEFLTVKINAKGAELVSVSSVTTHTEYIWNANPKFWGKSSPVLFPIVGSLKDNTYIFDGKTYNLPRHGFARDKVFKVDNHTQNSITFMLENDDETLLLYPFEFELRLIYLLDRNELRLTYSVTNPSSSTLYFSVGGHPAFAVPIAKGTDFTDYFLEFNTSEDFKRWALTSDGLIENNSLNFNDNETTIQLTKELFYGDALVFKNLKSTSICLKSHKTEGFLKFNFIGFEFFGIWSAKNADFVCLEPWCGIADAKNHDQILTKKEGIIALESRKTFDRSWSIEVN